MAQQHKRVLITGAAKRLGASIAKHLHQQGCQVIIHYHRSEEAAKSLCARLNRSRSSSAYLFSANVNIVEDCQSLIDSVTKALGGLDALVNNASTYYPTRLNDAAECEWDDLFGTNCKAPFFLSQAAAPFLKESRGSILNIADIQAFRPLKHYSLYCAAKAGLVSLTHSLAEELAPEIRVNAIAPGLVLPQETDQAEVLQQETRIYQRRLLDKDISPNDIAKVVDFLLFGTGQVTGQVLKVDGGQQIGF